MDFQLSLIFIECSLMFIECYWISMALHGFSRMPEDSADNIQDINQALKGHEGFKGNEGKVDTTPL